MNWDDPLDPIVITVEEVASGAAPVMFVMHEEGHGGWQFYDGGDVSSRSPLVIPKDELLKVDPRLSKLTDLPLGWQATRAGVGDPWVRSEIDNA